MARCTARGHRSGVFQNLQCKSELASSFEYVYVLTFYPPTLNDCAIPYLCLLLRIGVGDTGGVNLHGTVQRLCVVVRCEVNVGTVLKAPDAKWHGDRKLNIYRSGCRVRRARSRRGHPGSSAALGSVAKTSVTTFMLVHGCVVDDRQ